MVMGEQTRQTELLVIGGGSSGYAAAFRAAEMGLQVTLVTDEPRLGGVCLHRGCIPSKALLHATNLLDSAHTAREWGISFGEPEIDLDQLRTWKDKVVDQLVGGLGTLSDRHDIDVIQGRAVFEEPDKVRLQDAEEIALVEFEHAIIATGSRPIPLPGTQFESGNRIMDAAAALQLSDIPESLLIVGGGYIGLEMGMVYAALGSQITVVEMMDGLLPGTDRDLVKPLARRAENLFDAIHLNTKVTAIEEHDDGVSLEFEGEADVSEQQFDRVLIAIGRQPNTENLGLENAGVEVDDAGFVVVDEQRRTTSEHIFAVGDVVGEPMLAHKAMHEGKVAAEVIAGEPAAFDVRAVPAVVYTHPEIAWCGLSEDDAQEQGYEVEVGHFPWRASGRALTMSAPEGLTKIVFEAETGRVLGVGIVGQGAAELIAEGALAVEMGAVARDLALTIHPHPTLTETLAEAAEVFLGQPTHIFT